MRFRLRVHPAGGAALAAALLFVPGGKALATLAALLLHEGCHLLTMALCGVKRVDVELTPFGGVADVPGYDRLSCPKQAAIALSGVAGSALLAALWAGPESGFVRCFRNANLAFAFLNCLPLWPLDGARALSALARGLGKERAAARLMLWLSYAAAALLLALGVYGAWRGHVNPSLFVLAPYLAYAAYESALCQRIRGMESALMRNAARKAGQITPVQSYACTGKPAVPGLAGLMRAACEKRDVMLFILDSTDGSVQKVMSQAEIGRTLLGK